MSGVFYYVVGHVHSHTLHTCTVLAAVSLRVIDPSEFAHIHTGVRVRDTGTYACARRYKHPNADTQTQV